MIHVCFDPSDPRRLADVSQNIIDLSEGLPDVVDEIERAEERQPAPRNARSLYSTRHALENLYLDLWETRPDLFAPPSPPSANPPVAGLSEAEPAGMETPESEPAEAKP